MRRDAEFTDYLEARLAWLRRTAFLLCQDWQRADDLVQAAAMRLYLRWARIRRLEQVDAYVRAILVREFLSEHRSGWASRVSLPGRVPDAVVQAGDLDTALDVRAALARLPPRQRATLVLRFYCDLNVYQTAQVLDCSPGTVKSQTAKGLDALRRALEPSVAQGWPGPGEGTR
jgi:RNA polymerase sigma-70 factor (sigma-E family)